MPANSTAIPDTYSDELKMSLPQMAVARKALNLIFFGLDIGLFGSIWSVVYTIIEFMTTKEAQNPQGILPVEAVVETKVEAAETKSVDTKDIDTNGGFQEHLQASENHLHGIENKLKELAGQANEYDYHKEHLYIQNRSYQSLLHHNFEKYPA